MSTRSTYAVWHVCMYHGVIVQPAFESRSGSASAELLIQVAKCPEAAPQTCHVQTETCILQFASYPSKEQLATAALTSMPFVFICFMGTTGPKTSSTWRASWSGSSAELPPSSSIAVPIVCSTSTTKAAKIVKLRITPPNQFSPCWHPATRVQRYS